MKSKFFLQALLALSVTTAAIPIYADDPLSPQEESQWESNLSQPLPDKTEYPPLTQAELDDFLNRMRSQITLQVQRVVDAQGQMMNRQVAPSDAITNVYQNAIITLDVKRTLYFQLSHAKAVQSPIVRNAILQVMQQEVITPGDLAQLQSVIDTERMKMGMPPVNQ